MVIRLPRSSLPAAACVTLPSSPLSLSPRRLWDAFYVSWAIPRTCRAVPYGIYDVQYNAGHFCVGTSRETSQFAVDAIRQWWRTKGKLRYPDAEELLIEADAGGSNGFRRRLWKWELQPWADQDAMTITVCHFPTGASKWNPIEHRLFSHVSRNWSGIPLRSLATMLHLIRGTVTTKGLRVTASRNSRTYSQHAVTDREMRQLCIEAHDVCPAWNYTIHPCV